MSAENQVENTRSFQRAISVEFIRASGGYAVKARPNQKEPATGWDPKSNNESKSAQVLADIEYTNDNIGVQLHGDLVDVDVDGQDAHLFLTPALDAFLPSCAHVWGRKSRPRTHRVYLLKTVERFDPAAWPILKRIMRIPEVKVEIRGGAVSRGEYSLLPSSIHPSGEEYTWADIAAARATPSVAEPSVLVRGIRMAGAVAVLAPLWTEGLRQDLTMALAGFLHRVHAIALSIGDEAFSLDYDSSVHFLEVLLEVAGDDPADRIMRKRAFEATWKKAEKGLPVTGATHISDVTGDPDIVRKMYILLSDNPDVQAIDEFTNRFAVWQGQGLAVDMDMIKAGATRPFMTRRQFNDSYGHKFVSIGGKAKLLPELLWSLGAATRVQGLTFQPKGDFIVGTKQGDKINQWSGFEIEPWAEPVHRDDIHPFIEYLLDVVCSGNDLYLEWVLAWIADIFKHPDDKAGTALVLVGKQGAGKSILGHEILGKIIGDNHYSATNSVEAITSNFNVVFANKLLIQCDEATNNRQKVIAAKMKSLITDPFVKIEPKGVDAYMNPNFVRLLMTSNDIEDAVHLSDGNSDRRYTVLEVSSKYAGEVSSYWAPFVAWLRRDDTLPKIHRFLADLEYDRDRIKRPIVTRAKMVMQQNSWEPFDSWLASMVARDFPIAEESHLKWYDAPDEQSSNVIKRLEWPSYIYISALMRDYEAFCKTLPRTAFADKLNEVQMSMALNQRGLRPDSSSKRITIKEYDERKQSNVTKRVRLISAPDKKKLVSFLRTKYGFEALEEKLVEMDDVDSSPIMDAEF